MTAYMFPGQGSQKVGMGRHLFSEFPYLVQNADSILGYSIADLCLNDPEGHLNNTAFTQPALYVVNALSFLKKLSENDGRKPDYLLGHSLGEYNALWAAGVFDFETGLLLVQKRGHLMSQALDGGMAAVIGLSSDDVAELIEKNRLLKLSIANFNSYTQQVVTGPKDSINKAKGCFIQAGAKLYLPLSVNGAFHSSMMINARKEFAFFLEQFTLEEPQIPVIANLNALPYQQDTLYSTLSLQIDHSVQWLQSIRYLLLRSETEFEEIGPGNVLEKISIRIIDGQ